MPGLTALKVKHAKQGRHGDGAGLYLLVGPSGAKSWMLRVMALADDGKVKRRDIGLGSTNILTLEEAREEARKLRKAAKQGLDPVAERDRPKKRPMSFREAATACHEEMSKGWSEKGAAAFLSSLERHAFKKIGNQPVEDVDASAVRDVLAPVWIEKPALARKLRQRIGVVLNFAHSNGWREAEAPGRAVTMGLSKQPKAGNFAAMPYVGVPEFFAAMRRAPESMGRLALMFAVLTAARSGEVRSAFWSHFDLDAKLWHRPADLMKSREAHTVTLNAPAIALLKQAQRLRTTLADCLVFPGVGGRQQSDMTLAAVLRRYQEGLTVHGFRSSFRDWAAEMMPTIPDPVAEAALAHGVPDAVVAAYKRAQFLDLRRTLLDAWGAYCDGQSNVLRLVG
jgi:integrase